MKGRGYNMKMKRKGMVIFTISSVRSDYAIYHHLRRFYSTGNSLQLQLSTDISDTYHELKSEGLIPSITTYQLAMIQQEIENGHYRLGPLELFSFPFKEMGTYLSGILLDYPDIHMRELSPNRLTVVKSKDMKDCLVLMGLSVTLNRLFHGTLPENGSRLYHRFPAFIKTLENMNNIEKLYKVDMSPSAYVITQSHVLKAIKPFLGDSYVFRLVNSLFHIPICINGVMQYKKRCTIPPLGEITTLLNTVVLMEYFDRKFVKCYPTIRFTRFCEEFYVVTTPISDLFFNDDTIDTFLNKTGMEGDIEIFSRGDALLIGGVKKVIHTPGAFKFIILEDNGVFQICEPEEYC